MLTRLARMIRTRDDAGITLAELVVAMGITAILMTLGVTFFVNTEHSSANTMVTNQVTADARVTLDSWTSLLRFADWFDSAQTDRFEEITPTKIVFWASLDNRNAANVNPVVPQKIALLLRMKSGAAIGQLIEVRFAPGNPSLVQSVRQVAFNARPTGGATKAIFQPYLVSGGDLDTTNTLGCLSGATPTAGLCLQAPPTGAGMLDPTVAANSLAVSAGSLRGNPALNVDSKLQYIGGIRVVFTVTDPNNLASADFSGAASVNSGWPSS